MNSICCKNMYFSKEFLIGISFASFGIAGVYFLLSRRKKPTTHGYGMKNMEDFLEDENDKFFDAESKSFQSVSDDEFVSCRTMPDENLNDNTKLVKSIGELNMDPVEKQAFEDLQHNFKVVEMNCLELKHHVADAMYTFQQTANDQCLSIDSLKLEVSSLKKDLNRLTSDLLKNTEMQSTETNTEKPDGCKLHRLKTRVSVLESDVTKNSIDIVGINHMLMLRLVSSGAAAENDVSAGENLFELDTLNAQCHKPTSPTTSTSFTLVAGPPPAVTSENVWPPPPPPAVTSENFWPPPPYHAVTSEHFWLPPPPPAVTSENFWPPPPYHAVTSEHFWLHPPPPAVTSENFWPPPPYHAVTSEHFWLPPPPPAVTSENFWPPPPPPAVTSKNFWPPPPSQAVTSEHFWLPPTPPAVTSENFWPPPPPPPMTTGTTAFRRDPAAVHKPCASVRGA